MLTVKHRLLRRGGLEILIKNGCLAGGLKFWLLAIQFPFVVQILVWEQPDSSVFFKKEIKQGRKIKLIVSDLGI